MNNLLEELQQIPEVLPLLSMKIYLMPRMLWIICQVLMLQEGIVFCLVVS